MLAERLVEARKQTDLLFEILKPDALYERPVAERHRLIFYLGHLEAFDANLLRGGPQSEFDELFAFGIDPVGEGLPTDLPKDWPKVEEIRNYQQKMRAVVDGMPGDELLWNVAIEHRLMHAETLTYLLHQLPVEQKLVQRQTDAPVKDAMVVRRQVPAGAVILGRSEGFGWDNEFDAHTVEVGEFEIHHKVTNGEYLKFVQDGGEPPVFWKDEHTYRAMFEEIPMPLDWPVYVSHANASAYAEWAGKRLPTEAEWQKAAQWTPTGNTGFRRWDPVPVSADPGMRGNGWEWTSTLFQPFPGFKPFPFYPGYSANFFDDQHYVMKGGSARTAECLLRPSFRNWFQPNYPYAYCGFRCVTR